MPRSHSPGCVREAKPYGGAGCLPFCWEVNAKMEHPKRGHWVVGLIILIVLGYLAYHVAYLEIQ